MTVVTRAGSKFKLHMGLHFTSTDPKHFFLTSRVSGFVTAFGVRVLFDTHLDPSGDKRCLAEEAMIERASCRFIYPLI